MGGLRVAGVKLPDARIGEAACGPARQSPSSRARRGTSRRCLAVRRAAGSCGAPTRGRAPPGGVPPGEGPGGQARRAHSARGAVKRRTRAHSRPEGGQRAGSWGTAPNCCTFCEGLLVQDARTLVQARARLPPPQPRSKAEKKYQRLAVPRLRIRKGRGAALGTAASAPSWDRMAS